MKFQVAYENVYVTDIGSSGSRVGRFVDKNA